MKMRRLSRDESGATMVEFAFALPVLILMIWMLVQMGLLFRANSGIQHALGEGARFATLWPTPTKADVVSAMVESVDGVEPGEFVVPQPTNGTQDGSTYWDLTVTYTQETDMLLFPGPTVTMTRTKRVWVAPT
jgi:Flp pilus assembly protein TadG